MTKGILKRKMKRGERVKVEVGEELKLSKNLGQMRLGGFVVESAGG